MALLSSGVKFGVGAIAGAFITTALPIPRYVSWAQWHYSHKTLGGTPSCGDPGWLSELHVQRSAGYNELHPRGNPSAATQDDNAATAWMEAFPSPNGRDWITWTLERPSRVGLICIRNGAAANLSTFQATGRLKQIRLVGMRRARAVQGSGCERSMTFSDSDTDFGNFSRVPFDCTRTVAGVRLIIKSVTFHSTVTGLQGPPRDVALSDVRFYGY